ncbi:M48 family metalloprotease, partial [Elusimicrobiota bacterium]
GPFYKRSLRDFWREVIRKRLVDINDEYEEGIRSAFEVLADNTDISGIKEIISVIREEDNKTVKVAYNDIKNRMQSISINLVKAPEWKESDSNYINALNLEFGRKQIVLRKDFVENSNIAQLGATILEELREMEILGRGQPVRKILFALPLIKHIIYTISHILARRTKEQFLKTIESIKADKGITPVLPEEKPAEVIEILSGIEEIIQIEIPERKTYEINWRALPQYEVMNYAERFSAEKAEDLKNHIEKEQVSKPVITGLKLDDDWVRVSIIVDDMFSRKGITDNKIQSLLEDGYKHLDESGKRAFRNTFKDKTYFIGRITRENDKWQSRNLMKHYPEQSLVGINDYLFESYMSDPLFATLLIDSLLIGKIDVENLFNRLGGEGSPGEAVGKWRRDLEQVRYNVNQNIADVFIEGNREKFRFISSDTEEMSAVYSKLKMMINRLLAAEGYDPENFNFHLSDYKQGNAFVMLYANHIVVNIGFLWGFIEYLYGGKHEGRPDKLAGLYEEDIAFIMAHEIAHLKQGRDAVNRGESPQFESLRDMKEKMEKTEKTVWQILEEKGMDHVEIYNYEIDADRYALQIMDRAGYNVRQAYRPWQMWSELMKIREQKDSPFGTHPVLVERVKNIKREILRRYFENDSVPVSKLFSIETDPAEDKFTAQLMNWAESRRSFEFNRTRMRDFHRKIMEVNSVDELISLIDGTDDYKELEMAATYGAYSLIYGSVKKYMSMWGNPFSKKFRRLLKMYSAYRRIKRV